MSTFSPSEIKIYYSGASVISGAQTDPESSLGGNMSSTEVPNTALMSLFYTVSGSETISGSNKYRAVFVKNTNRLITLAGSKVYFQNRTGQSNDLIYFGLETPTGTGYSVQQIANESTTPSGIIWYYPETSAAGITVGDIGPEEAFGVWFKREFVSTASGSGSRDDWFTIVIEGQVI